MTDASQYRQRAAPSHSRHKIQERRDHSFCGAEITSLEAMGLGPERLGYFGVDALPQRRKFSNEELNFLFALDHATGTLFWNSRPIEMFKSVGRARYWNSRYTGAPALNSIDKNGYRGGRIYGVGYKAHHVIWTMISGEWPTLQIDHINGNKSDNRPNNLRHVTRAENARNVAFSHRDHPVGIGWRAAVGKWEAYIGDGSGSKKRIGFFKTMQEALLARKLEAERLGYTPRHGSLK